MGSSPESPPCSEQCLAPTLLLSVGPIKPDPRLLEPALPSFIYRRFEVSRLAGEEYWLKASRSGSMQVATHSYACPSRVPGKVDIPKPCRSLCMRALTRENSGPHKHAWQIVRQDFIGAVQHYFSTGELRSEVLANRLKEVLPEVISLNQTAFVQGRKISDNVLLAHELGKNYHTQVISPRCAIKIDLMKAFDSLNWDFILNSLEAMEISPTFLW
ncbi:hypothetical protein CRG98_017337 [Punica granatum]|uniref:Reverse transcriptase domain-containing protein n=1 Tax=Punica granatum TaxID=22663 RepID=A0A2I0K113_PUNGR|nr:hypothetical protein CRG98_017337 [Punica granatum]